MGDLKRDLCERCQGRGVAECPDEGCDGVPGHMHVCGCDTVRGTHDPRSAIDFDAEGRELERLRARVAELGGCLAEVVDEYEYAAAAAYSADKFDVFHAPRIYRARLALAAEKTGGGP